MQARILLTLGLLSMTPPLFAQAYPEPPEAVAALAPRPPKPAKAPRATVAPAPELAAAPSLPAAPESAQAPKAAPVPAPAPAPAVAPAPPAPPRPMGQMVNVRIDVALTDSKGAKKILTMTVADGESGMNRTFSNVPAAPSFSFNADARPIVVGNRVRLQLTAEATVPVDGEKAGSLSLRQSQTLILNDGDSVEIARAADPVSDRTFVLSVAAKIQR